MPYCPVCKTEYQSNRTRCADCGAALVAELIADEDKTDPDMQFVVLKELVDTVEVLVLKDALEKAGIPVLLTGEQFSTMRVFPSVDSAVLVPKPMLDQARDIVRELSQSHAEPEPLCSACGAPMPQDIDACPTCGAPSNSTKPQP